jgi:excisionase family DNA binding protein
MAVLEDQLAGRLQELLTVPSFMNQVANRLRDLEVAVKGMEKRLPAALMPVPVAAQHMGVSERTVWRLARKGDLPVRKLGRRTLIDLSALGALSTTEVVGLVAERHAAASRSGPKSET